MDYDIQDPVRNSQLFKFVKVRNPRPKPKGGSDPVVISYEVAEFGPSELFQNLQQMASDSSLSAATYLEMEAAFKSSARYLPSLEEAAKIFPSDMMETAKAIHEETVGKVKEILADKTEFRFAREHDSSLKAYHQVWDNLFIHGLSLQPEIGLGMHLCDLIRGMELQRLLAAQPDDMPWDASIVDRLAKAPIIIPKDLIPADVINTLPAPSTTTSVDQVAAQEAQREASYGEIVLLQDAKEALQVWAEDVRQAQIQRPPLSSPKAALSRAEEAFNPSEENDSPKDLADNSKVLYERQLEADIEDNRIYNEQKHEITISRSQLPQVVEGHPQAERMLSELSAMFRTESAYTVEYINSRIQARVAELNRNIIASGIQRSTKTIVVGGSILELDAPQRREGTSQAHERREGDAPCEIRTLGVGDLLRVEQRLICYKPGEIAHIENVLLGEEKGRTVRRLKRTETTITEEFERLVEEEKDLQSTDRMEMESESEKTITKDFSLESGLNVSGSYGMVDFEASLGFSMSQSSTEANRTASKFAKEVVEKTRRKVSERIKTSKSYTVIEEFEETNTHKITNTSPTHQVGIYRWVDKFYRARLINYGRRAFIEFTIPEPAAYHIYNKAEASNPDLLLDKPIHPSKLVPALHGVNGVKSHEEINESNYALISAFFNAQGVAPLPSYKVLSTESLSIPDQGGQRFDGIYTAISKDVLVQEGYTATGVWITVAHGNSPQKTPVYHNYHKNTGPNSDDKLYIDYENGAIFVVQTGIHTKSSTGTTYFALSPNSSTPTGAIGGVTDKLTLTAKAILPVLITAKVEMIRKKETYEKWQIAAFKAIMDAYNRQLAEYNDSLRQLKSDLLYIQGDNPGINRQTEQRELKRGCLEQMLNVRKANNWFCFKYWGQFGAINEEKFNCEGKGHMYPAIDFCGAIHQGKDVMFFEQAIDWRNMNYMFYGYYWGRKCRWKTLYNLQDTDPLFTKFLQSGMARVVVPIRPGFEAAVMNYLETGLVWNGENLPVIGDPLFVDISTEVAEALDYDRGPIADDDPRVVDIWEFKLPTNLVLLQDGASAVPENGLPCTLEPTIE